MAGAPMSAIVGSRHRAASKVGATQCSGLQSDLSKNTKNNLYKKEIMPREDKSLWAVRSREGLPEHLIHHRDFAICPGDFV